MSFNAIGIIVKPDSDDVRDILASVVAYLKTRACTIQLDESACAYKQILDANGFEVVDRNTLRENCDLVITLGGDGTILNAARSLVNRDIPLLGINLGRLGFLADVSPDDFEQVLDDVFAGNYQSDERFLLHAEVIHKGETVFSNEALNDVVVHVRNVARMIEFETCIDGEFVNRQGADGLIIATPTGSTAYAMSSGGPIVHASLNAMSLVPICPHTLSSRPLVVSADSGIEVTIANSRQAIAQVSCDGQAYYDMEEGDVLQVRKKAHTVKLLHPNNHSYYQILRAKLRWSAHLQGE